MLLSEKKYFTIREVSQHFAVAPSLIRYWEKVFKPIFQPNKNSKGARRYTTEDLTQFSYIYHLVKEKGYSLAGARKVMQKRHTPASIPPAEVVQRLHKLRAFLLKLKEQIGKR
ncbi:MAG: MerR family transcriptional regulator [Candidatus Cardinium sp.]|nr:MerR family transcriptional regulator [Candidatus Cardinium sp.]